MGSALDKFCVDKAGYCGEHCRFCSGLRVGHGDSRLDHRVVVVQAAKSPAKSKHKGDTTDGGGYSADEEEMSGYTSNGSQTPETTISYKIKVLKRTSHTARHE
eukprot:TRINITY_DN57168_c0_g1_i1.p1 TRINITY_DN57168_c0_g1~~TRINITY_DN57168_c0_g1_i1.p1  ORF type:complete len:103 (+),score=9.58 TRINITY_DN57168_c0_g1_i1:39-347(+)